MRTPSTRTPPLLAAVFTLALSLSANAALPTGPVCQAVDAQGSTGGSARDYGPAFLVADNFRVAEAGTLTSLSWQALLTAGSGSASDPFRDGLPPSNESVRIRILPDAGPWPTPYPFGPPAPAAGVPDATAPIFAATAFIGGGLVREVVGTFPSSPPLTIYRYTLTLTTPPFPAVLLDPSTCLHLEIQHQGPGPGQRAFWLPGGAPGGNAGDGRSYALRPDPTIPSPRYSPFSEVGGDLAWCLSLTLANLATTPCPRCETCREVCPHDAANGNGLVPPGIFAYPSCAPGSVAGPGVNPATIAYRVADDFRLVNSGVVTSVCFSGFFLGLGPLGGGTSAPASRDLELVYFNTDPATGLPGTELARFTVGQPGVFLYSGGNDHVIAHPPLPLAGPGCYFLCIQYRTDTTDPARASRFVWTTVESPQSPSSLADSRFAAQGIAEAWQDETLPAGLSSSANLSMVLSIGPVANPNPPDSEGTPLGCSPRFEPPKNDACQNARTLVGLGTFPFDSRGSTDDGPDPPPSCNGNVPTGRTVWFRWTAPCAGTFEWSLCGTPTIFTSVLQVFRTSDCADLTRAAACTNLGCPGAVGGRALARFNAGAGEDFVLILASWDKTMGQAGTFTLSRVEGACDTMAGACCAGSTCSVTTALACVGAYRLFRGVGVACNPIGENLHPCCRADFNQNGTLEPRDVFEFLKAYFSPINNPLTDWFGDGVPNDEADVIRFLNSYFERAC